MTGPSPKSYCNHIPGSAHPRPVHPHPPQAVVPLHRRDRPAGRALRTGVPQRDQLVVRDVRTQPALRALDPLLELRQVLIDQLRPRTPAGRSTRPPHAPHVPGHGVVRDPSQLAGVTQRPGQIERFQHVHDLLGRLHVVPPRGGRRFSTATAPQEGPQPRDAARQTNSCRADPMTASGQLSVAATGQPTWPPPGSFSWPLSKRCHTRDRAHVPTPPGAWAQRPGLRPSRPPRGAPVCFVTEVAEPARCSQGDANRSSKFASQHAPEHLRLSACGDRSDREPTTCMTRRDRIRPSVEEGAEAGR